MNVLLGRIMRHLSTEVAGAKLDTAKTYEEAVRALNSLQSNAAYIEKAREQRNKLRHLSLPLTSQTASRIGIEPGDLDKLSVIHVSGTKGKGSTCAFCEHILRDHGFKTGFYSSPHLVEVRERFRINGRPLSKEKFSSYFWDCYHKLESTKDQFEGNMPQYFRFLTVMAFHVFLQEQVDVAIIEVGIGGTYDCTNIVQHPVVCGVSSLGMDHTSILGDTQDQIAWHKAGIFKPSVPAVSVPQPGNSLQVLINRASEVKCPLYLCPNLESYNWQGCDVALGIAGQVQYLNASLALQLCQMWLENKDKSIEERNQKFQNGEFEQSDIIPGKAFDLTETMVKALKACCWPGRTQTIKRPGLTYYLDGAHTPKSVQHCVQWFMKIADEEKAGIGDGRVLRILLFNSTGDRKPESLLKHLVPCKFDAALFCPNIAILGASNADQTNYTVTPQSVQDRCITNRNSWLKLMSDIQELPRLTNSGDCEEPPMKRLHVHSELEPGSIPSDIQASLGTSHILPQSSTGFSEHSSNSFDGHKKPVENGETPSGELSGCAQSVSSSAEAISLSLPSIQDALQWASQGRDPELPEKPIEECNIPSHLTDAAHIQVLCTGSLHLIGGLLKILQPDLNN